MLYVVHIESSNAPYGADFAALIAPVSISLFDAALRVYGAVWMPHLFYTRSITAYTRRAALYGAQCECPFSLKLLAHDIFWSNIWLHCFVPLTDLLSSSFCCQLGWQKIFPAHTCCAVWSQPHNAGCCQVLGSESERLPNNTTARTGPTDWSIGLGESHGGNA